MKFSEVRAKYPQYNDLSDEQLAVALHRKFYADIPYSEFVGKIGLSAAEDPGAIGAFGIGVGRFFDNGVQGIRQAYNAAIGDDATLEQIKADEADKDRRYGALQDIRPVATTLGEIGGAAAALPVGAAATVPATALRFAAAGALPGLVSYGTGEERALRGGMGAAGGALGAYAPKAIGGVVNRFRAGNAPAGELLADVAQVPPSQLAATLRHGATELAPGVRPTTPQAAMNPGLSQLWRTLETLPKTNPALTDAKTAQDVARKAALFSRVGQPGGMTAAEAADVAGAQISERAGSLKRAAKAAAGAKFDAVDPAKLSSVQLPVDDMEAAFRKIYADPLAGKPGGELASIMDDIRKVTTPAKPKTAILRSKAGAVDPSVDSLSDAVRKWGGLNIKEGGGELRWLRESDLSKPHPSFGPFARRNGGLRMDEIAERAHEAGYLDNFDQKELLEKLMDEARGTPVFSSRGVENRAMRPDELVQEPVPWNSLKALRTRLNDIITKANRTGEGGRDAVVAGELKGLIDSTVERVAKGEPYTARPGYAENFTPEMRAKAQDALRSWREYKQAFDTGPAFKVNRFGSDGLPQLQNAEVPRAFANAKASQTADAQQFLKMISGDSPLDAGARESLRKYLVADLMEKAAPRDKPLSPAQFDRWMNQRSESLKALFPENRLAALEGIRSDLIRSDKAANLARVAGSDTAQKLQGTGALVPALSLLADYVPTSTGRAIARGLVGGIEKGSVDRQAERLLPLLLDPEIAAAALERAAMLRGGLLNDPRLATGAGRLGAGAALGLLGG